MTRIVGDYKLLTQLGRGSVAQLWLAEHVQLAERVLIKVFAAEVLTDGDHGRQLFEQLNALTQLKHPNILTLSGHFMQGRHVFLIYEYFEGTPLDKRYGSSGVVSVPETMMIARGVLEALKAAHEQNIFHRNIKPGNVLIGGNAGVKLTDFGLTIRLPGEHPDGRLLVLGSPHYRSPEQIRNPLQLNAEIDIYAVGVLMYRLLLGSHPYTGQNAQEIMRAHFEKIPPTPRQVNPEINTGLSQIVMKAMAKKAGARYQSPSVMLYALDQVAWQRPATAAPRVETRVEPGNDAGPIPFTGPPPVPPPARKRRPTYPTATYDRPKSSFDRGQERLVGAVQGWGKRLAALKTWQMTGFAFLCAFLVLLIADLASPEAMGLPLWPSDVLDLFLMGVPSAPGLSGSILIFMIVFSGMWLIHDAGHGAPDLVRFALSGAMLVTTALLGVYLVFLLILPNVTTLLVKLGLIRVVYGKSGFSGPLLSNVICFLLWYSTVAALMLMARSSAKFFFWKPHE